jgi:hypothetical protein
MKTREEQETMRAIQQLDKKLTEVTLSLRVM